MKKQIGYIGLGKMGFNMVERLLQKGYEVGAYDPNSKVVKKIIKKGARGFGSINDLLDSLSGPRVVWIMVPHKAVDKVLEVLIPLFKKGDTIIDGGNSPYSETIRRAKVLKTFDVNYLDVGVSGGPKGAREGACVMVGGDKKLYIDHKRLFRDISAPKAFGYMGASGAGHFVKMVHNGIEYGMMQAIAEGFDILKNNKEYKFDLIEVARVYNARSVIESRLIGWMKSGYESHGQDLKEISGSSGALGEGAWTVEEAHKLGIPDKIIHNSLRAREISQKKPSYQGKIISTLRNQFGGHAVKEGEDVRIVK